MAERRVFVTSIRAGKMAARVRVLAAGVGSVNALCRMLNGAVESKTTLYPNRLHALLSGDPTQSINPKTIAFLERAVPALEADRPDAVAAGRAALAAAEEETMSEVTVRSEFVLKVTQEELRLIGLGLAGKLKGRDVPDALALNVRLMEQRSKHTADVAALALGQLEAARRDAEEARASRDREIALARAGDARKREEADDEGG